MTEDLKAALARTIAWLRELAANARAVPDGHGLPLAARCVEAEETVTALDRQVADLASRLENVKANESRVRERYMAENERLQSQVATLQAERDGARLVARQMQERLEVAQGELASLPPPPDAGTVIAECAVRVVQRVAELPDRTSPDDWPDAMLVTADELRVIVSDELEQALAALQSGAVTQLAQAARYDLITNYRCGSAIEEMERSDDGEWVRFEDVVAALQSPKAPQGWQPIETVPKEKP